MTTIIEAEAAFAAGRLIPMDEYDRIVGCIHDGALEDDLLSAALEELRLLFRANSVTLILRIPGVDDVGLMMVAGNLQGRGKVTYYAYYHKDTPFSGQPVDKVFTIADVMTEEEWRGSVYYQDYSRDNDVFHLMGADISTPESGVLLPYYPTGICPWFYPGGEAALLAAAAPFASYPSCAQSSWPQRAVG